MTHSCPTVHSLLAPIIHIDPTLIGIDGPDGSGKSTLASELAGHTHFDVVCLDDFLDKNKGTFVKHIDIDGVRDAIRGRKVIVEGVCLLQVLSKADLKLDLSIYVQRIRNGLWADEDSLGLNHDVDEYLKKLQTAAEAISDEGEAVPEEDLSTEIIRYHHEYHPHENADLTFSWNDS